MLTSASDETVVAATVRYVGTPFAGWQVQPNARTVQGEIERALSRIAGVAVRVHGAGRTDAGVHALGQVCSFAWRAGEDFDALRRSLSSMLGPDIQITALCERPQDFHARKSATGKTYAYSVSFAAEPDPFSAPYVWTLPRGVAPEALRALCGRFAGMRDFAGFQCSGAEKESTVRTLFRVELIEGAVFGPVDARDAYRIEFHGDGFLYKMVRNIVGTMTDVARGALPDMRIDELLASPGPYRGFTAPAHGLALLRVDYPEDQP